MRNRILSPGPERLAALRATRDRYVAQLADERRPGRRAELNDLIGRLEGSIAAELVTIAQIARAA